MKRTLVLVAALMLTLLMTFGGVASASSHLDEEEDVLGDRIEHVDEEEEDATVALAETGFELSTGIMIGGAMLLGGGGLLLAARRRGAKQ